MVDANYLAGAPSPYVEIRQPLCEHMLTTSPVCRCYVLGCDYRYSARVYVFKRPPEVAFLTRGGAESRALRSSCARSAAFGLGAVGGPVAGARAAAAVPKRAKLPGRHGL